MTGGRDGAPPATYRTVEGDMLDAVAHRLMGGADRVAALMEANPHVAGLPALLPAGLVLAIPAPAAGPPSPARPIRLWGRA